MEKNITIEQYLDLSENKIFFSGKKNYTNEILLVFLAAATIITSSRVSELALEFIKPMLITTSIILFITGIMLFIFKKKTYKYSSDNKSIKIKQFYFNIKERDKLVNLLTKSDLSEIANLEKSSQDALILKLAFTENKSLCLAQVLVYIPYEYVNATNVIKLTENQANTLLSKLV